jgi:hypothetical protein
MTRDDVRDILTSAFSHVSKAQVDRFIAEVERESLSLGNAPGECWYHPFSGRSPANDLEILFMFQEWIAGLG